jgi:cardiolipin synthase
MYPYLITVTLLMIPIIIGLIFIESESLLSVLKMFFITIVLGLVLIFIKIRKNRSQRSEYQLKYNKYLDQFLEDENKAYDLTEFEAGVSTLIRNNSKLSITYNNKVELISNEEEIYNQMLNQISKAKHHIHLQFYIIRDDRIGHKFKKLLIEKANQGVKVRIIYDGLGSYGLKKNYKEELKQAGVEIGIYNNIFESIVKGKLNHRNHRKLLIVDGNVGFIGDINIGDEYTIKNNKESLEVQINGEAVGWMQRLFLVDWYYIKDEEILSKDYFPQTKEGENLGVQIVNSNYDSYWNGVQQSYFNMITVATESIYIATTYLVLDDSLLKALQIAALKGVDVNIILSEKTDFFLLNWATTSYFKELLKANANIYLYSNGFLHTKILAVDNKLVSLGSANFNTRSLYLDYEANAVIFNEEMTIKIIERLKYYLKNSQQIILDDYQNCSLLQRIKRLIGRLIAPLT